MQAKSPPRGGFFVLPAPANSVCAARIDSADVPDRNSARCGATLADIFEQARIGNVYVNVHLVEHPAGVIRGQLMEERRRRGRD